MDDADRKKVALWQLGVLGQLISAQLDYFEEDSARISPRAQPGGCVKRPDRITLELYPLHGGSYTQLSLSGPVPSAPQGSGLRRLLTLFALWSGYPVDVVLFVDRPTASWSEVWVDALSSVPGRHLTVTFRAEVTPHEPQNGKAQ